PGRPVDEGLQAGPREGEEAAGRRGRGGRLRRQARGHPHVPERGVRRAGVRGAHVTAIGMHAEMENVEYAVWIKRWQAKDFDLTMNTTPGYADPDTAFFRALHSTKGQNWNSWSVPDLDALLEDGRRTLDQKKRKEIYDRAQIMILENVPHLWLYSADTIDFTQTSVKGFKQHPTTLLYGF